MITYQGNYGNVPISITQKENYIIACAKIPFDKVGLMPNIYEQFQIDVELKPDYIQLSQKISTEASNTALQHAAGILFKYLVLTFDTRIRYTFEDVFHLT